jgi:hypothetical protein
MKGGRVDGWEVRDVQTNQVPVTGFCLRSAINQLRVEQSRNLTHR